MIVNIHLQVRVYLCHVKVYAFGENVSTRQKNVNSFSPQKSDTYLSRSRHLEAYLGCHVCLFKAGAAGVRFKEKLLESLQLEFSALCQPVTVFQIIND